MNDPSNDSEFERLLRSHDPTAPDVSRSEIMFESGRWFERNKWADTRHQLRLWRRVAVGCMAVTLCSLAGTLYLAQSDRTDRQWVAEQPANGPTQPAETNATPDAADPSSGTIDRNAAPVAPAKWLSNFEIDDQPFRKSGLNDYFRRIAAGTAGLELAKNLATTEQPTKPLVTSSVYRLLKSSQSPTFE